MRDEMEEDTVPEVDDAIQHSDEENEDDVADEDDDLFMENQQPEIQDPKESDQPSQIQEHKEEDQQPETQEQNEEKSDQNSLRERLDDDDWAGHIGYHPNHDHQLTWTYNPNKQTIICDVCEGEFTDSMWHCQHTENDGKPCDYDVCFQCMADEGVIDDDVAPYLIKLSESQNQDEIDDVEDLNRFIDEEEDSDSSDDSDNADDQQIAREPIQVQRREDDRVSVPQQNPLMNDGLLQKWYNSGNVNEVEDEVPRHSESQDAPKDNGYEEMNPLNKEILTDLDQMAENMVNEDNMDNDENDSIATTEMMSVSLSPVDEGSDEEESSSVTTTENVTHSDYGQYVQDDVPRITEEKSTERKEDAVQSQQDITVNPAVQRDADDDANVNGMDTLESELKQGDNGGIQGLLPNLSLFDPPRDRRSGRKRPRSPTVGVDADDFKMDTDGSDDEPIINSPDAKKRRLQLIRRVYMLRKQQLHSSYVEECDRIQRQCRPRRTGLTGDVQRTVSRRRNRKLATVTTQKQLQ